METAVLNIEEIKALIESGKITFNDFRVENETVFVSLFTEDNELDSLLEEVELQAELTDVLDYLTSETGNDIDFDGNFREHLSWETETYYGVVDMRDWVEMEKESVYEAVFNLSK